MGTYMLLISATPEGIRKIAGVGGRYEAFRKSVKRAGGRLIGAWALLGHYDYMALVEVPAEKDIVRLSLSVGSRGTSRVETLRAFSMQEFTKIARKL